MTSNLVIVRHYSPIPVSRRPPDEVTGAVNFDEWLDTHEHCTLDQLVFLLHGYQPWDEPRDEHARRFSIYAARVAQVLDDGMIDLRAQLDQYFMDGILPGRMVDGIIVFEPVHVIPKIKPLARLLRVGADVLDAFEEALRRKYPDYASTPTPPEDRYYRDALAHDRGGSPKRDTDVPVNAPAPASSAALAAQPLPEAEIAAVAEIAWDEARVERLLEALWVRHKLDDEYKKPSTVEQVRTILRFAIERYHVADPPHRLKCDVAKAFKTGPGQSWSRCSEPTVVRYLSGVWEDLRTAARWFEG